MYNEYPLYINNKGYIMNRIFNCLELLENTAQRVPEKIAVFDGKNTLKYKELLSKSRSLGSALSRLTPKNRPVAVLMEKSADTLAAFFGIVYAGCSYVLLNPALPCERLKSVVGVLKNEYIITDSEHFDLAKELVGEDKVLLAKVLFESSEDEQRLLEIRSCSKDTDPLYINFTSGSTGVPKGVVINHRSVIDFTEVFDEEFEINENDVIANQAPFDFDVSVKDIYSALNTGAKLVLVPKELFSNPTGLLDYLDENKITTMIWAVSALCLITTFHALDYKVPKTVNKILFSGEVMPEKHLKQWVKALPEAMFVNLYGPTEITCNCTFYKFEANNAVFPLPIGKPFKNETVFLLDENGREVVEKGVSGEICVSGTALSPGYYNAPEQTAKAFVQNPLNTAYPEIIYKTGDLAYYDENGDLCFSGRKDFQIKYKGHRIELEEIEGAIHNTEGIKRCCCIFDEKKSKLFCFYIGSPDKKEIHFKLKAKLPEFMVPGAYRQVESLPLTKNGKIDRKALKKEVCRK